MRSYDDEEPNPARHKRRRSPWQINFHNTGRRVKPRREETSSSDEAVSHRYPSNEIENRESAENIDCLPFRLRLSRRKMNYKSMLGFFDRAEAIQREKLERRFEITMLGHVPNALNSLIEVFVYEGNSPFTLYTPSVMKLRECAKNGEMSEDQRDRFIRAEKQVNYYLPYLKAGPIEGWARMDSLLRKKFADPRIPSEGKKKEFTRAKLLELARDVEVGPNAKRLLVSMIDLLSKYTTKDLPLEPNMAFKLGQVICIPLSANNVPHTPLRYDLER